MSDASSGFKITVRQRGWAIVDAILVGILAYVGKLVWPNVQTRLEEALFFVAVALLAYVVIETVYRQAQRRAIATARTSGTGEFGAEPSDLAQPVELLTAGMRERLRFAETLEAEHARDRATWEEERAAVAKQCVRIEEQNENLREEAHAYSTIQRYGVARAQMPALGEEDLKSAREYIAELLPAIETAHRGAADLMSGFLIPMSEANERSDQFWLAAFLFPALEQASMAYTLVQETISAKGDPRTPLTIWYWKYNWMRAWIIRLAELRGVTLASLDKYARWRNQDEEFFSQFNRKMRMERLVGVADVVATYRQNHAYPIKLPNAST
jgi:hypothetical protein